MKTTETKSAHTPWLIRSVAHVPHQGWEVRIEAETDPRDPESPYGVLVAKVLGLTREEAVANAQLILGCDAAQRTTARLREELNAMLSQADAQRWHVDPPMKRAVLLAAAPEMLAALEAALRWFGKEIADCEADLSAAEIALRKQEGPCNRYSTDSGHGENTIDLAALRAALAKAKGRT